jgi:hypothetical protein
MFILGVWLSSQKLSQLDIKLLTEKSLLIQLWVLVLGIILENDLITENHLLEKLQKLSLRI